MIIFDRKLNYHDNLRCKGTIIFRNSKKIGCNTRIIRIFAHDFRSENVRKIT